jgi:hypothetical protein
MNTKNATIKWSQKKSYEDAMDSIECIYLFVVDGKPSYAGICYKSVFGGSKREIKKRVRSPRYGASYAHLINGLINSGGLLYIGKCLRLDPSKIKSVESSLINYHKPEQNKQVLRATYQLKNTGDVPEYLQC